MAPFSPDAVHPVVLEQSLGRTARNLAAIGSRSSRFPKAARRLYSRMRGPPQARLRIGWPMLRLFVVFDIAVDEVGDIVGAFFLFFEESLVGGAVVDFDILFDGGRLVVGRFSVFE